MPVFIRLLCLLGEDEVPGFVGDSERFWKEELRMGNSTPVALPGGRFLGSGLVCKFLKLKGSRSVSGSFANFSFICVNTVVLFLPARYLFTICSIDFFT